MKRSSGTHLSIVFASAGVALITGCAGPATPLGSVWTLTPVQSAEASIEQASLEAEPADLRPQIQFSPGRQVLHGPSPLRVVIEDPMGDLRRHRLKIRYNGHDVSRSFLAQSKVRIEENRNRILIENPVMRLTPTEEHVIELTYGSSTGAKVHQRYEPPVCSAFASQPVKNVGRFQPDPELLAIIEKVSLLEKLNPAFYTALIAQESSFNSRVVSYAKALGLTQVTSIAEEEIIRHYAGWPQFPGIQRMAPLELKVLVMSGKIHAENEWRLDPARSVMGGATYLQILTERWSTEQNTRRIEALFQNPEVARTRLILASYNSGYARVSGALAALERDWLKSPDLNEARKYVNRIFSFCHHFAEDEVVNGDNEV